MKRKFFKSLSLGSLIFGGFTTSVSAYEIALPAYNHTIIAEEKLELHDSVTSATDYYIDFYYLYTVDIQVILFPCHRFEGEDSYILGNVNESEFTYRNKYLSEIISDNRK